MITLEKTKSRINFGGRIDENPDPRNYMWGKLGMGTVLTPSDHIDYPFEVLNQLSSNACGGFAAAQYKFVIEYKQIQNKRKFSPYTTYGWRVGSAMWGEGMYMHDVNEGVLQHGIPFYQPFDDKGPYTFTSCRKVVTAHKDEFAEEAFKFRNYSYYACNSWTEVMQAIKLTGGCLIMIPIYDNYGSYHAVIDKQSGNFQGYHFLCAYDYTDDFKYVKCINSWGNYNDLGGHIMLNVNAVTLTEASAWVDRNVEDEYRLFDFKDVEETRWSYKYIQSVAREHHMDGYEDNSFKPEKPLTRAEAARVFCSILKLQPVSYRGTFWDIDHQSDHWASQFIQAAYDRGLIAGIDNPENPNFKPLFMPDEYLTRAQMSVLLCKAYKLDTDKWLGKDLPFVDVSKEHWAKNYIAAVSDADLMGGWQNEFDDYVFAPDEPFTREQMAVIITLLTNCMVEG